MLDSNHMDSVMAHQDAMDEEGKITDESTTKAQDLHDILEEILHNYITLQESGFYWDL